MKELATLHAKTHRVATQPLKPGDNPLADVSGELFDIRADLELGDATEISLRVRGTAITYETKTQELVCLNRRAPLKAANGRIRLQILADRTSLEIFAADGLVFMPMAATPKDNDRSLAVFAQGGAATIHSVEAYELRSIWSRR